jgi:hypothetical protein
LEEGNKVGRSIFSWLDDIKFDLRNLGVNKWRTGAFDRTAWASVVRRAEAKLKVCTAEKEKEEWLHGMPYLYNYSIYQFHTTYLYILVYLLVYLVPMKNLTIFRDAGCVEILSLLLLIR